MSLTPVPTHRGLIAHHAAVVKSSNGALFPVRCARCCRLTLSMRGSADIPKTRPRSRMRATYFRRARGAGGSEPIRCS